MLVYFNGQFLQKAQVAISPDDRGFLFADGVYDVIRSYEDKLFKAVEHLERLAAGLHTLGIKWVDAPSLLPVAQKLLVDNKLGSGDAVIYIQVTRGAAPRTHEFP